MQVAACLAPRTDVEHQRGDFGAVGLWIGDGGAPGGCATLQDRGRRELHLRYGRGRDETEERESKNAWLSHEGLSESKEHLLCAAGLTLSNACEARAFENGEWALTIWIAPKLRCRTGMITNARALVRIRRAPRRAGSETRRRQA